MTLPGPDPGLDGESDLRYAEDEGPGTDQQCKPQGCDARPDEGDDAGEKGNDPSDQGPYGSAGPV